MWAIPAPGLPEVFCLERNFVGFIEFLRVMREKLDRTLLNPRQEARDRRRVGRTFYDLAKVRHITPAAALMFAAEYDRALATRPSISLHTYNASMWKPEVRQLFDQLGLLELLQIQRPEGPPLKPGRLQIVPFTQSEQAGNEEAGKLLISLAHLLEVKVVEKEDAMELMGPLRLFDAMVEATENTKLHAYDDVDIEQELLVRRWWMTGAVDSSKGQLTVVIYDRGASIPATLPHSEKWGRIDRILHRIKRSPTDVKSTDQLSLRLAISEGATSTGLKKHGKGLGVLKRVVDECDEGQLVIRSRYGEFRYETGRQTSYRALPVPIQGTLIEWTLTRKEWKSGK